MDTHLQNQNGVGTILYWKNDTRDIIFPFTKIGEVFRGGMFWCIPNLGPEENTFEVQNGEYRKQEGRETKKLSGKWGALASAVTWNFKESVVTSQALLTAEQDTTYVRPGFHPYFPISHDFELHIGEVIHTYETILHDTRMIVIIPLGTTATLISNNQTTTISYSVEGENPLTYAFCIWTDNKDRYICIEPVIGKGIKNDGSPLPFTLQKNETLLITSVISLT